MTIHDDASLIEQAITEWFGERCPETEPGCPCCDAWAQYDSMKAAEARPAVRELSDDDRDWIDNRADELFRESERQRGGVRPQTITARDYRDYFVVDATRERILSAVEALDLTPVREALIHARNQIQHPDQLIDEAIALIDGEKGNG